MHTCACVSVCMCCVGREVVVSMCREDVGVVYICVVPVENIYVFGGFPLVSV